MAGELVKPGGGGIPIIPITSVANKSASESPISRPSTRRSKLKIIESQEAVEIPAPLNVLVFGDEASGKTHLGLTFPEPVCVIDTEKRYHLILKKFRTCDDCGNSWCTTDPIKTSSAQPKFNAPSVAQVQAPRKYVGGKKCPKCESTNIRFKDIKGITCKTSDDAIEAMNMFFGILSEEYEKTGKVGTILVDSITKNWNWCKNEYSVKKYGAAPDQGTKLNPRDDYSFINPKHNERFRDKLLSSPWNVVFTATSKNLYAETDQFKIVGHAPEGQKFNPYAVDIRIHNEQGTRTLNDGTILGDGNFKSSITKNSLLEGNLDPIPFLDFKMLMKVRGQLEDMACMNDAPETSPEPETETPDSEESPEEKPEDN